MLTRSRSRTALALGAVLLLTASTGCGDERADAGSSAVSVVTAFYPLQFVTERVGGPAVRVENLAKPGAEPHDLELSISQVGQISDADLTVYLGGFQPAVDEAVAQEGGDRAFDVATVQPLLDATSAAHDHEGGAEPEPAASAGGEGAAKDPHVWLDPTRLAAIGDRIAERLAKADAAHAADYTRRAAELRTELERLDAEFTAGLKTCQRREIITSHTAFGYLAERYELEQVGITGLSPDTDAAPQRLAGVLEEAREHRATTIFFETLVSPKLAETIAAEVGAKTAVLDPLEGLAPGSTGDYLGVMRTNLATLKTALGCGPA